MTKRWWWGFVAGMAFVVAPAYAEQRWIVAAPTLTNVTSAWREGVIREGRDGDRSFVTLETDGQGHPLLAIARDIAPAADARGRFLAVRLRIHQQERLANLQIRIGANGLAGSWLAVPIPFFTDREYNFLQEDTWATITLPLGSAVATGSPDPSKIDAVGLMVTDRGTGMAHVDFAGAALVDAPKQGVVSFTFDDGYKEHLEAARQLAARGWAGTAYVIPQVLGTGPTYLTKEDVAEIARLGSDVAGHDHPPLTEVPPAELEPRLHGIQDWLRTHGYPEGARHFAYPLGKQEPQRVRPTVAKVFTTARIASGGPETIPPADPQLLRVVNVLDTTKPEEVGAWARRARDDGEWLILMFHWLPEKPTQATAFAMADFRRVLQEVAATGVRVAPITKVWREVAPLVAARETVPPPRPIQ